MCFEWGSGIEVRREESCTGLMWRGFDAGKQAEMVITDWSESSGIERNPRVSVATEDCTHFWSRRVV